MKNVWGLKKDHPFKEALNRIQILMKNAKLFKQVIIFIKKAIQQYLIKINLHFL